MSLLQSVIMGLIQGITEFLPVSSSGHLAIFKNIFQLQTDTGIMFDVMLHVGTLLAVFVVYFKDIRKLTAEGIGITIEAFINFGIFFQNLFTRGHKEYRRIIYNNYRKFVLLVVVSAIPTGIIGYVSRDLVETAGAGLIVPGICLLITGVLLLIADFAGEGRKLPKNVTYSNSFIIGICQGIAVLPGLSRSGTTITACLISGFDRRFAVKYSFIMSIPAILGSAVLELKDIGNAAISPSQWINYGAGTFVAAVAGYICIKTMLVVARKKKFKFFGFYCFLAGIFAIAGFFVLA